MRAHLGGGSGIPQLSHPGDNPEANLKSISHRCHPILEAFVWELTEETIDLPLGCIQGGPDLVFHSKNLAFYSINPPCRKCRTSAQIFQVHPPHGTIDNTTIKGGPSGLLLKW